MDKRKTADVFHGEKVSPAYFHEQSRLKKRLDEYQMEQNKCIRKILISQEALATGAFAEQTISRYSVESLKLDNLSNRQSAVFSKFDQPGYPRNMTICETKLRKLSTGSDTTRHRKLSLPNRKKATRQYSDPLQGFFSNGNLEGKVAIPRRIPTTGGMGNAAPSKAICNIACCTDKLKNNLSNNQTTTRENLFGRHLPRSQASRFSNTSPSHLKFELSKINFTEPLCTSLSTQSKMLNETSAEEQCKGKHVKDSLENDFKNLYHREKLSNHIFPSFQKSPNVSNEEKKSPKKENASHKIAARSFVITKRQFRDSELKAEKVGELPTTGTKVPDSELHSHRANGQKNDTGNVNRSVFRKFSLSTDESKMHLHEQTDAKLAAGAIKGVRYPGNAWSDNNKGRRKISTVKAPQGIAIDGHSSLSKGQNENDELSNSSEKNSKALRNFRRLAFVAVAAERFNRKNCLNSSSENSGGIVTKRKLSAKERLEQLQRPTESFLRQIVAEDTPSKPLLQTRSKSMSGLNAGLISASGVSTLRRVSQVAIAIRILIGRESRNVAGNGFSNSEPRKDTNEGKTVAEMMNELKHCRYLRSSTIDHE